MRERNRGRRLFLAAMLAIAALPLCALDFSEVIERYGDRIFFDTTADDTERRRVEAMFNTPVNINTAPFDVLIDVPLLSAAKAREVIKLREKRRIFATYELVDADILTEDEYAVVKLFITMEDAPPGAAITMCGGTTADVSLRATNAAAALWKCQGLDMLTAGHPYPFPLGIKHWATLRMPGFIDAVLLTEHDPYEREYFDIVKGALLVHTPFVDTIALGALTLSFGQGLIFSTGRNSGKNVSDVIAFKSGTRIAIDRGASEQWLLGAALEHRFSPVTISAFGGLMRYDASMYSGYYGSTNSYVEAIDDYPPAHADDVSLARKTTLHEYIVGVNADVHIGPHRFGMTGMFGAFNYPIKPPALPDNRFDLTGQQYGVGGVHWDIVLGQAICFGEIAVPIIPNTSPAEYIPGATVPYTADIGGIASVILSPTRSLSWQFSARYYGDRMPRFHARAFADADARGEYGVYNALSWNVSRLFDIDLFVDVFRHTYLRYGETSPGTGADAACAFAWKPLAGMRIALREKAGVDESPGSSNSISIDTGSVLETSYENALIAVRAKALINGTFHRDSLLSGAGYFLVDGSFFPCDCFAVSAQALYYDARSETLSFTEKDIPGEYASSTISGIGWLALVSIRFTFFGTVRWHIKYRIRVDAEHPLNMVTDEIVKTQISISL